MSATLLHAKAPAEAVPARAAPPQQAPIEIGRTDDPAEHEADRVAAELLRMPDPHAALRRCACGGSAGPDGECAACKAKRPELQRSPAGSTVGAAPPIIHQVISSPGRSLDIASRAYFEPRLGIDLSAVRVHDDARAAESAGAVRAHAYTVGNHIAFGHGKFAPGPNRVLAHELVHVAQQHAGDSGFGVLRRLETLCDAPSGLVSVGGAGAFGTAAERFIEFDYCRQVGCVGNTYFDNGRAGSVDPYYAAFLIRHNPGLTTVQQMALMFLQLRRPDILTDAGARKEYYEIKPDSTAGRADGRAKIQTIVANYAYFGLPYVPGATFVPTPSRVIGAITVAGYRFEILFNVRLLGPGLVVYEICLRGELLAILEALGMAELLAALAALLRDLVRAGPTSAPLVIPVPVPVALPEPAPVTVGAAVAAAPAHVRQAAAAAQEVTAGETVVKAAQTVRTAESTEEEVGFFGRWLILAEEAVE